MAAHIVLPWLIAGAVEVIDRDTNQAKPRRKRAKYLDTRSGRIRLAAIRDNSAASIEAFVRANVKTGTTLITDGHRSKECRAARLVWKARLKFSQ